MKLLTKSKNLSEFLEPLNAKYKFFHQKWRFCRHFVIRMVDYARYLWKNNGDHDWDYAYLLSMMRWKLERMSKTIRDNEIISANNRISRQLWYAARLIELIQTTHYEDLMQDEFDAKWGEAEINFYPTEREGFSRMEITHKNANTEEEKAQMHAEQLILWEKQTKKKQELYDRLYRHMNKYLERWWD